MDGAPSGNNPFLTIWTHPGETLRRRLDAPDPFVLPLIALESLAISAFTFGLTKGPFELSAAALALAFAVPLVAFDFAVGVFVVPAFLAWCGRMLGGTGRVATLRTVYAWSCLPALVAVALRLIPLALGIEEVRGTQIEALGAIGLAGYWLRRLSSCAATAFSLAILTVGVAEAHGLDRWRAIVPAWALFAFQWAVPELTHEVAKSLAS